LRTALFKRFFGVEVALAELPAGVRDEFATALNSIP